MKQIAESIRKSFRNSEKKHLFLTGRRGIGKSTLLGWLKASLEETEDAIPGITTYLIPNDCVMLKDNITGMKAKIGVYDTSKP